MEARETKRELGRTTSLIHTETMNEPFRRHLESIAPAASIRAIARKAGLEPSTLSRQLDGSLKVETVVAIQRAYDAPFLPAFVAAGFITQAEADAANATRALAEIGDRSLAGELLRRLTEAESRRPEKVAPLAHDTNDDVSGMSEDDVKSRYATAANRDQSADRLDPDLQ